METIEIERSGAVAWVWLNRPRWLNAIGDTMLAELEDAFRGLGRDEAVRAVVVAGRGPAFSAGFDIAWMEGKGLQAIAEGLAGVESVYDVIEACSKPVIAALHGVVMGGGLLLALVCDRRLATEGTSVGAPEVKIGIFPNLRFVPRLVRVVGEGAARQIVLSGEPVDAAAALRMGLVEQVVPVGELHGRAQALAGQLADLPGYAVQAAKAAFAAARRRDFAEWERAEFAMCWNRPERKVAMQAFLQSRIEDER
jgi:enoyl-CoA hydratase/carnithine racemase